MRDYIKNNHIQTNLFGKNIQIKEEYPPIDIIMSGIVGANPPLCCATVSFGFKTGFNSGNCSLTTKICENHPVSFIDNPFMNYNHDKHFELLKLYRPEYGTIRDYFTPSQCNQLGVPFYGIDVIKDWIEELRPFVKNIIVIPKHRDLLKQTVDIENIIIGASIISSYAQTKLLNVDDYKKYDCKIHILGGTPEKQIKYYNKLRDQVISCDSAFIGKLSNKAVIWNPNIITKKIQLSNIFGKFKFRNGKERMNIVYPINLAASSLLWRMVDQKF